jgi:hypothetical protein
VIVGEVGEVVIVGKVVVVGEVVNVVNYLINYLT